MTTSYRLSNGITLVCEERPGSRKVSMMVAVKGGTAREAAEENGLTFLMQEACSGGTATRSRSDITEAIENIGASIGSSATAETISFGAAALVRDTEKVFSILADVMRNPAFDAAEVEKTKIQIGQALLQKSQNPGAIVGENLMTAVYGGHGRARPPMGTAELVASFTPAQLREKHAQMLASPGDMVISFAGDIDFAQAQALAEKYFGDLPPGAQPKAQPASFVGGDFRVPAALEQMNITFGFPAPGIANPDRYAVVLLQELLSGGMSSPLFQEIREKRSLVYSVGAGYNPMPETGLFAISAGTGKGNVGELIRVSMGLLGGVIRNGFTDEQIETARTRIMRGIEGAMEHADRAGQRSATQIINLGRIVPLEEYKARIDSVTNDDIRRACAALLQPGKYALSCIGPQDAMPSEDEIRALIAEQLQEVTLPAPAAASLRQEFNRAAAGQAQETAKEAVLKSTTLPNGFIVVTAERPGLVATGAWVGAGADHETPELSGATHMNEHMMFKGTPSYPPGSIPQIVQQDLFGELNAYTSKDKTAYYFFNLTPQDLEKAIDICGEMVFQANISEEEYAGIRKTNPDGSVAVIKEGEQKVVLEEIKRSNDNIGARQSNLLFAAAYPGQAHSRPVLGTRESLLGISATALRAYRDRFYAPNNVIFSAAGPVRHEDFVALIERKFGHLQPMDFPPLEEPRYQGGVAHTEMPTARLCTFTLGAEGVSEQHPDYHAYEAFSAMLGGGESSRLWRELVNNRSFVPGIGAGHQSFRNAGMVVVGTAVPAQGLKPVIAVVYQELHKLASNPSQAELDKIKARMEMGLLSAMETSRGTCDSLGNETLTHGRLVMPEEALEGLRRVTLEDIKRVGRKILESSPALSMVVPPGTDKALLPTQEELVAMRDGTAPAAPQNRPEILPA